jgi:hypothetical protein
MGVIREIRAGLLELVAELHCLFVPWHGGDEQMDKK